MLKCACSKEITSQWWQISRQKQCPFSWIYLAAIRKLKLIHFIFDSFHLIPTLQKNFHITFKKIYICNTYIYSTSVESLTLVLLKDIIQQFHIALDKDPVS